MGEVVFTPLAELPRVERRGATPGHYDLQLLGPEATAATGPVLVASHCAECCSDPACPRCWLDGASVELELVPLPSS